MDKDNGVRVNINQKSSTARPRRVSTEPNSVHAGRPTEADLAAAFSDDAATAPTAATSAEKHGKKIKRPLSKLRKISIAVLTVGVIALVAGIGCLVYNILRAPNASDAEYLVEVDAWQREDEPSVVWKFTEIGKGTLTTNGGVNVYDFTWAFDDGKLKIDTDWLYTLNDEYEFSIDQNDQKLTLKTEDQTLTFVPAPKVSENTSQQNTKTETTSSDSDTEPEVAE